MLVLIPTSTSANGADKNKLKKSQTNKAGYHKSSPLFVSVAYNKVLMRDKIYTMTIRGKESTRDIYYSSPARGEERKVNLSTTIVSCAVTLAIGLLIGVNFEKLSGQASNVLSGKSTIDFSELNDVYDTLADNFDGSIDKSKIIEGAKRGLVDAVGDPYTYYMTASEYSDFTSDLNGDVGAGIGVEIGLRENFVKVLRTTKDNPARKAGVLAGDIIYKVNDEDVTSLDTEGVAKKLRGAAGTEVKLTVVRDNEEKEFTLVRETINNESVYVEYRGKTAIMTISRFDEKTGELAEKLAKELKDKGCDKIILDLRGNGGGYVDAAVYTASLWLDGVTVTDAKSSNNTSYNRTYTAKTGRAILKGMKTIVLVNGSTASAAEILTGALKDNNLATVLGEKTYGKGCMQALEPLNNGDVLRVTIANWYTPNGANISKEGIKPDKVVERSYEQINKDIDPQLDAALDE